MPLHQTFLSFNSGEISEYLLYRTDFAKVPGAAQKMRNFLPLPFGAAAKRPGTLWLTQTLVAGANSKAFGFTSSDGLNYILHFTQGFLKIYREDGTVAASLAFITGYTFPSDANNEDSIRGLQMVQVNDVAFFTHPRLHPLQLVSVSDTSWTLGFIPFERAPVMDENSDMAKTYTVASNPVAAGWVNGQSYSPGQKAFTNCEWLCIASHQANGDRFPGGGGTWKNYWRRMFYTAGQAITLLGSDGFELPWKTDYRSYTPGRTALDFDGTPPSLTLPSFYLCVAPHTMDNTYSGLESHAAAQWELPLPAGVTWVYVFEYFNGTSSGGYFIGDLVYTGGSIYRCIAVHAATGGGPGIFVPGVTSGWGTYWELKFAAYSAPVAAVLATPYVTGTRISYGGLVYAANSTHYPDEDNAPGESGAPWTLLSNGWTAAWATSPTCPGKYFKISPQRDDSDFQIEIAAVASNSYQYSAQIVVEGPWNFYTFGTWTGTFQLQRSINGGASWQVIRSWQSSADRNVADAGTEDVPTLLRLQYFHGADGSSNPRAILVPERNHVTGFALMNLYVGATMMTGIAKTSLLSGSTFEWSEGAFDLERGFPRTLTLHGFRLWFAATVLNPVSIWASRINDFFDFETGTEDDAGIFRTLAASNHTPIRWLASTRRLFLGTSMSEWVEGSERLDSPITPTNVQFREYTPTGSCPHQPLPVNDGLFFLGRQGGRLYELGASENGGDTFAANDLSMLSEHLTAQGISGIAYQQTRQPCLWAVTRAGNLLSFNYVRSQQISAWAMHNTASGLFRDVVVFPSETGDDEVFFIIDRGANSHLERFPQGWLATQEAGTVGNYVDAAGLTGGSFPIISELKVPPQDMSLDGGGTQGRRKRANEILLNVYQSFGGGVTYDGETVDILYANTSDLMDTPVTLKSGWQALTLSPGYMDDLQFSIVHSAPYPFTVRAAVLRWNLHEP